MGNETSEEIELTDAECLYRLWVRYEFDVVGKKRRASPSAAALKLFNKALNSRSRFVLELYIKYLYTSSEQWPTHMRVYGYTKPENIFRRQNLGRRVDEVVAGYLQKEAVPEYAYRQVEWTKYMGKLAYIDGAGDPKIVFGGEKEIQRWKDWAKEKGFIKL